MAKSIYILLVVILSSYNCQIHAETTVDLPLGVPTPYVESGEDAPIKNNIIGEPEGSFGRNLKLACSRCIKTCNTVEILAFMCNLGCSQFMCPRGMVSFEGRCIDRRLCKITQGDFFSGWF